MNAITRLAKLVKLAGKSLAESGENYYYTGVPITPEMAQTPIQQPHQFVVWCSDITDNEARPVTQYVRAYSPANAVRIAAQNLDRGT